MVSVTATSALAPWTRVLFRVTAVLALLYFSPSAARRSLRRSSEVSAAFSLRASAADSLTSPEKPSVSGFFRWPGALSTSASVRSVRTASARRWKVALVCWSTTGAAGRAVAALALPIGSSAAPAATEAAAATTMAARPRVRPVLLDFTNVSPLAPAMGDAGLWNFRMPCGAPVNGDPLYWQGS